MSKPGEQTLGTCNRSMYEHAGSHPRFLEIGQSMPPFACVDWSPLPSAAPVVTERRNGREWRTGSGCRAGYKAPDGSWHAERRSILPKARDKEECVHCNETRKVWQHCHRCGKSMCSISCEEWHLEKCNPDAVVSQPEPFYKPEPGEWIGQRAEVEWKCCDCGLVHAVKFRLAPDGQLETSMTRVASPTPVVSGQADGWILCSEQLPPFGKFVDVVSAEVVQICPARLAISGFGDESIREWRWYVEDADSIPLEEISHWRERPSRPAPPSLPKAGETMCGECDHAGLTGCDICGKKSAAPPLLPAQDRTLTDGSPVTEDHRDIDPNTGMQKGYVVLSATERAKGFVRPVRRTYLHTTCGTTTTMGLELAETYARDPSFYSGTFCCTCRSHFPLDQFVWDGTNEQLGS